MVVGQPHLLGHLLELIGVDLRHPWLPALAVGDVVGLGVLAGGRRAVVAAHLAALGRAVAQHCAAVDQAVQGLPGDAGVVGHLCAAALVGGLAVGEDVDEADVLGLGLAGLRQRLPQHRKRHLQRGAGGVARDLLLEGADPGVDGVGVVSQRQLPGCGVVQGDDGEARVREGLADGPHVGAHAVEPGGGRLVDAVGPLALVVLRGHGSGAVHHHVDLHVGDADGLAAADRRPRQRQHDDDDDGQAPPPGPAGGRLGIVTDQAASGHDEQPRQGGRHEEDEDPPGDRDEREVPDDRNRLHARLQVVSPR